ncbi:hypothetical protein PENTCL1PPCAC_10883, partial [Pristionchus entomophagus]
TQVLTVSQNEIVLEDLISTDSYTLPSSDFDSMEGSGEDYLTPDYVARAMEPDFILSLDEPTISVERPVIPPLTQTISSTTDQSVGAAIEVVQPDEDTMCAPCFQSCCIRLECSLNPLIDSVVTLQPFCARECPLTHRENTHKRSFEMSISHWRRRSSFTRADPLSS